MTYSLMALDSPCLKIMNQSGQSRTILFPLLNKMTVSASSINTFIRFYLQLIFSCVDETLYWEIHGEHLCRVTTLYSRVLINRIKISKNGCTWFKHEYKAIVRYLRFCLLAT